MSLVHCKKAAYDVYIGRPSIFGNPYSHKEGTKAIYKVDTREEAVAKFEEYLLQNPTLMAEVKKLKGKTLGCWCAPLLCHGSVILKYANGD